MVSLGSTPSILGLIGMTCAIRGRNRCGACTSARINCHGGLVSVEEAIPVFDASLTAVQGLLELFNRFGPFALQIFPWLILRGLSQPPCLLTSTEQKPMYHETKILRRKGNEGQ